VDLVDDDTAELIDPVGAVSDRRIDLFARGDDDVVRGELAADES